MTVAICPTQSTAHDAGTVFHEPLVSFSSTHLPGENGEASATTNFTDPFAYPEITFTNDSACPFQMRMPSPPAFPKLNSSVVESEPAPLITTLSIRLRVELKLKVPAGK